MFIADGPAPTLAVASSCAQQGYTPHQVSDEAAYSQQMAGKPGWDGFLGTQDNIPFFVTSTPGSKAMHDAFQQYEPSVLASPQYSVLGAILWTTGLLIAAPRGGGGRGRRRPTPMTGTALVDGVYTMHSTNLGGMTYHADLRAGPAGPEPLLVLGRHQERPVVPAVRPHHDLRPAQQSLTLVA